MLGVSAGSDLVVRPVNGAGPAKCGQHSVRPVVIIICVKKHGFGPNRSVVGQPFQNIYPFISGSRNDAEILAWLSALTETDPLLLATAVPA